MRQYPIPVLYYRVANVIYSVHDPKVCLCIRVVICFAKRLDPALLCQVIYLGKLFPLPFGVDPKRPASILIYQGEDGNVTGSVCDVYHVLKRNSPVFIGHMGVYINSWVFVNPLVYLEDCLCLGCVIDNIGNILNRYFFLTVRGSSLFPSSPGASAVPQTRSPKSHRHTVRFCCPKSSDASLY